MALFDDPALAAGRVHRELAPHPGHPADGARGQPEDQPGQRAPRAVARVLGRLADLLRRRLPRLLLGLARRLINLLLDTRRVDVQAAGVVTEGAEDAADARRRQEEDEGTATRKTSAPFRAPQPRSKIAAV